MKMSDVFELPLRDVEDSYPLDANGVEVMSSHEEDLAAVHAINNHDALVEALELLLADRKKNLRGKTSRHTFESIKTTKHIEALLEKAKS